jgi:hypothetical protein
MKLYRVKEFNSAYNEIFNEGKGWIYVSNPVMKNIAKLLCWHKRQNSCLKYTIEKVSDDDNEDKFLYEIMMVIGIILIIISGILLYAIIKIWFF